MGPGSGPGGGAGEGAGGATPRGGPVRDPHINRYTVIRADGIRPPRSHIKTDYP
ncbi:MAG: hypothetical protein OKBPIBMD_01960 [Chlorobi bacterium]|nr:hypothetical protein [Chlorobiota bacterium]